MPSNNFFPSHSVRINTHNDDVFIYLDVKPQSVWNLPMHSSTLDFFWLTWWAACHLSFQLSRSSLAVYHIWNKSFLKLTNTLLLRSGKCYFSPLYISVKWWSPLRITYTTWLSCDKVMNCKSLENISFALTLSVSRWLREVFFCCPLLVFFSQRLNFLSFVCLSFLQRKTNCPAKGVTLFSL